MDWGCASAQDFSMKGLKLCIDIPSSLGEGPCYACFRAETPARFEVDCDTAPKFLGATRWRTTVRQRVALGQYENYHQPFAVSNVVVIKLQSSSGRYRTCGLACRMYISRGLAHPRHAITDGVEARLLCSSVK